MKACPFCAEEIQDAAIVCKHCHRDLVRDRPSVAVIDDPADAKYQKIFALFESKNGAFTATMNWAALLFGALWYLAKGLWAKGLIIIVLCVITAGVAAPFAWIYAGVAGNYDYYLLKRKRTQFW